MTPEDLFDCTHAILESVGYPAWSQVNDAEAQEELAFLAADGDEPAQWALVPAGDEDWEDSDCVPVGVDLATALIRDHLHGVLLERGWQVQASVRKDRKRWRLVDCLSPADGGGDRLCDTVDYPWGEEELAVLCDSVRAVMPGT